MSNVLHAGVLVAALLAQGSAYAAPAQPESLSAAGVRVLSLQPARQVEGTDMEWAGLSPSGRWAVFTSSGPGARDERVHIADLSGRRAPATVSFSVAPLFVGARDRLVYWRTGYEQTGLAVRDLNTGQERRLFPRSRVDPNRGSLSPGESRWNEATGEVFLSVTRERVDPSTGRSLEKRAESWAVRLTDGRLRRLPLVAEGVPSPAGDRLATTVRTERKPWNATILSAWVSDHAGRHRRRITSGQVVAWLDDTRHLLVSRQSGSDEAQGRAFFRVDVATGEARYLHEQTGSHDLVLSHSRRWLGTINRGALTLVSTVDGRRLIVPLRGVRAVFWGPSDSDLYVRLGTGWQRARLALGRGGSPAPFPKPDLVKRPLGPTVRVEWQPLTPYEGPWETFHASPEAVTAERVGSETWVGTTQGLRVLDADGTEKPLLPWQQALRGRRVDSIAVQGETAWLATRRSAPYNSPGSFESAVVRADTRAGTAEQRLLDPRGFGSPGYVSEIIAGPRLIARLGGYGELQLWEADGTRQATSPQNPATPFYATCFTLGADGTIWTGSRAGISRWDTARALAEQWSEKHGLPSSTVISVAEAGGRVWVGTAAGPCALDPVSGKVVAPPPGYPLGDEAVSQLISASGTLYAVAGDRLAALDLSSGRWRTWTLPPGPPAALTWDGTRVVGAFGKGSPLLAFDGHGGWVSLLRLPGGQLAADRISTLLVTEDALWCGHEHALSRLEFASGTWRTYELPGDAFQIQSLAVEGKTLWVGLWRGGLIELDPDTGEMRRWLRPETPADEELEENRGSDLVAEAIIPTPQVLFVLTHMQLLRVDRQTRAVRALSLRDLVENGAGGGGSLVGLDGEALWLLTDDPEYNPVPRLVRVDLTRFKPEVVPNRLPLHDDEPRAIEPSRGFWVVRNSQVQLGTLEGQVLERFPIPRRLRAHTIASLAWSPGSVWFATEGNPSYATAPTEIPFRLLVGRVRLPDGAWEELPLCPLSGVRQMVAARDALWVATNNGLGRLPLPESHAVALREPNRPPAPPDREAVLAIHQKDLGRLKELLDQGLSVNTRPFRMTLLAEAVSGSWTEGILLLLERGADVNAMDGESGSPLDHAQDVEIARLLLDRGASPNPPPRGREYPLLIGHIVMTRNAAMARLLIERGADVNVQEPSFGLTPLLAAIQNGDASLVQILLARGARVNVRRTDGETPLLAAVHRPEIFRLLLERGGEVNAADNAGTTPLHRAAHSGEAETVRVLLGRGAKLEAIQKNGWTPLLSAAAGDRLENAQTLIAAGANVNARSRTGQTALMFAASRGRLELIRLLLSKGARVNVRDWRGKNASKHARENGNHEVARVLAAAGEKQ